jgi:5'-nucleotidase
MEGAFFGVPAIALSAAYEDKVDFDKVAEHALEIVKKLQPVSPAKVINVNIPVLGKNAPKGVKVVPHSINSYEENYKLGKNSTGDTVYLYAGGKHRDKGRETDTTALMDGYITITALHFDLTDSEQNQKLDTIKW